MKKTIETIINEKATELELTEFDFTPNLKSYNGLAKLDYNLLKNVELEENEYELYYAEQYNHITIRIANIDTESRLLRVENETIDTEKKQAFLERLNHYAKKYGKDFIVNELKSL